MTNLQYKMLEIYYNLDIIEHGSLHIYHETINSESLGKENLDSKGDEVFSNFSKLEQAGFVKMYNMSETLITELGIKVYIDEKDDRERKMLREDLLFKAQLDNITSTLDTNESIRITNKEIINNTKAQKNLSIATLVFIFIGTIFSILQYFGTTKVMLPQVSNVEIFYLDSLKQNEQTNDSTFKTNTQQPETSKYYKKNNTP